MWYDTDSILTDKFRRRSELLSVVITNSFIAPCLLFKDNGSRSKGSDFLDIHSLGIRGQPTLRPRDSQSHHPDPHILTCCHRL